jgi:phenylalanyl-tRNA synthetase beta chain
VTWSFVPQSGGGILAAVADASPANPIAADLSDMRPSLIPGSSRRSSATPPGERVALFEVGHSFGSGENDQRMAAAAVRRGRAKAGEEGRN